MRRQTAAVATLTALALLAIAPAAQATYDPLGSGTTKLTLDGRFDARASLPTLFIVSSVQLEEAPAGSPLTLSVGRADGVKCERCWRIVPGVSSGSGREGLCDRCVEALAEPVES